MNQNHFVKLIILCALFCLLASFSGWASENITAQEAYDLVCNGNAALIDIRTIEEATFIGVPACEDSGNQIAYLIPFNIWDGSIPVI